MLNIENELGVTLNFRQQFGKFDPVILSLRKTSKRAVALDVYVDRGQFTLTPIVFTSWGVMARIFEPRLSKVVFCRDDDRE